MALTKPKLSQNIDTDISVFNDPILVLHQGSTTPDIDVGFLMNRSNGLTANAAIIWQESSKSFVHILTTSTGVANSNLAVQSYANVSVGNVLLINNAGIYVDGTLGSAGQVLASDGSKTYWGPSAEFSGGTVAGATIFQSNLVISNTTTSTSTVTGALVVQGGAGIAGNVYADKFYTATGINWSSNGNPFTANTANYVYVTESTDDSVAYDIPYISPIGVSGTYKQLYSDATGITFNPSTNTLNTTDVRATGALYTASGVYWSGNGQAFTSTTIANTAEITANLTSGQNVGLSLAATGVAAGNYGSATSIPTIVVDNKGRITSVTSNAVSTTITLAGESGSGSVAGGGTLTVNGTANQIATTVSGSTITIAFPTNVTAPGNLTVIGNLIVQGNTTTLNTETLTVEDLNITVANGAATAEAADGAGLTVAGADARLLYKSSTDSWVFNKGVFASGNLVANSGTTSTSITTGALVVAGGVGISGNVRADKFYTTNGLYWAGNGVAFSSGGGGITYTASATAPGSPTVGDQWYKTTTDVLYEYVDDGTSDYWVDIQTPTISASSPPLTVDTLSPFLLAGM